jgi:hypothetical protein
MGFGDSLGLVFPDGFPYLRVNAKAENIGNNTVCNVTIMVMKCEILHASNYIDFPLRCRNLS